MLFLVNESMVDINIGNAALIAIAGYAVVFFGLILLMFVVMLTGKIMVSSQAKKSAAAPAAKAPAPAAAAKAAPGSAGEIKLHDVNEKDAAMIMAIVANKLQKPLNELRFKSIREVK